MDFAKFISLIDSQALYFSRVDQIAEIDPFEATYPNEHTSILNMKFEDFSQQDREIFGINSERDLKMHQHLVKHSVDHLNYQKEVTYINCWHINNHESAAMWKIYSYEEQGIAIQSSFKRLSEAINNYKDFNVLIGKIKYIDYTTDSIPNNNGFYPFIHKRMSFAHENELRGLIWTPEHGKNEMFRPKGIINILKY